MQREFRRATPVDTFDLQQAMVDRGDAGLPL